MENVKRLSHKSKWYLPRETRIMVIHYARQYNDWVNELNTIGSAGAIKIDGMPHAENTTDTTARDGMRRAALSEKIRLIEDTAMETDKALYKWILIGVTQNKSYKTLRYAYDMPVGERQYYQKKREFYYKLSKKI